ncbi:lysosomal protective protein-like [Alosa sapidissima]|uniref:lysosomal protective protein-like n=1 Tax=Alosa sapidissima TaxID=34773 RepID=UPI001C09438C|nr:lysosomal protective protein-like [Alosa sapidissima]XP_041966942.1 lysosomal protective protein-like [Alosa sapidissima]
MMFLWCYALAVALCLTGLGAQSVPEADLVSNLPGLAENPSFKHYSGYVQAGQGKYFHYWFVESQNNPSTDPVILWLNGGPGCSAMEGMLSENGPFHLRDDGTVYINPYSWNQVANVLYLESPAGVGFSYSTSGNYATSDPQVAEDNYEALQNFFSKFPSFLSNDFYVFAESYGGVYGPSLAQKIVSNPGSINFKGMGIGNGMSSYALNDNSLLYFGYYHGLLAESLWSDLNQQCCTGGSCNFYSNSNTNCQNSVYQALYLIQDVGLNIYNLYGQCYGGAPMSSYAGRYAADMSNLFRESGFSFKPLEEVAIPGNPMCINGTAMYEWLNNPNVRAALHIPSSVQSWELCSHTVGSLYQRTYKDMTWFYQILLQQDLQLLVYNGDVDMACNFLGGKWFVESLNQQVVSQYQPWYYQDQIAGYIQQYEKITFMTVKGSGHMVPQYKPGPALQMLKNYLANSY